MDLAKCGTKHQVSRSVGHGSICHGLWVQTLTSRSYYLGCHHVRAENGGDEEAQFFANFIIDTEKLESVDNPARALTILDIEVEQGLKI